MIYKTTLIKEEKNKREGLIDNFKALRKQTNKPDTDIIKMSLHCEHDFSEYANENLKDVDLDIFFVSEEKGNFSNFIEDFYFKETFNLPKNLPLRAGYYNGVLIN